ncbi:MAG TPA: hypothetical protein VHO70_14600 [Chitinispirillaceae bacterium]|nr:hypothetical protein [Chitinispirillaceae bacterium]
MILKKILTILLSFSVIGLFAQVQISESSSSRYAFSWNLEQYRIDTVKSGHCQIFFDAENTVLGENGESVLPAYSILLGIPPEGEIRVGFNPEAVKTITLQSALLKHRDLVSKRQPDVVFKNPWISEPVYGSLQGMRTARLIIRPFIHDEKTNTVRMLQKGFCSIEFPSFPVGSLSLSEQSSRRPLLRNMVINYPVAQGWYAGRKLAKVAAPSFPLNYGQVVYRFSIGDGSSGYNEMTTDENGILKIPGDLIVKTFGKRNINEVKLYASYKGELPAGMLDSAGAIPSGLTEVPLLRVDRNKNTYVDSDDYFLAFVTGASDWIFIHNREYSYNLDRYDDYRKYWLTVSTGGGMSVNSFPACSVGGDTICSVENGIIFGKNSLQTLGNEGGLEWCWFKLSNASSFDFPLQLPGLDTSFGSSHNRLRYLFR